ncbi:MAG: D-alanyl-D-alanine carboxypeptidase family protein [Sphingomonadaceae bacterium]
MNPKPLLFIAFLSISALPLAAEAPPFDTPAPVAFMKDLSSGALLYSKAADRRIPPASMAKIMTVHVAFDMLKSGEAELDQRCRVRPETWEEWHGPQAGSTMFLSPGEEVSLENLIHGVVTVSGNDASVVLAECLSGTEEAFVALMNRKADAMGLDDSNFGNPVGWPDGGVSYTTARDLARLAQATIEEHPGLYEKFYGVEEFTWGTTMRGGEPITQPNRNPLLGRVAGADGLKTGHTAEAGYGFTGSAEQDGRRLVMVIAGLEGYGQRVEEAARFMDWGFNAWKIRPLFERGEEVGAARVQLGDEGEVALVAPRDIAATLPAGTNAEDIRVRIVYDGPLKAPVARGARVAGLVVETPATPPQLMPLVAAEAVGEAGFFDRVIAGFKSLLG